MSVQDFGVRERFDFIKDLGSGNFGVAKLMRERATGAVVAIKFIELGERVDRNVEREIINHRTLNHPNIIAFKEVFLTSSHLGIMMEYASGGELFERIVKAGKFSEDEARYFFQQLLSGVDYCHSSGVCHRDLKLENTLLDGNPAPRLKICDFGYSKSALDSQPKSTVGTPAYIAPEVLQRKEYNGQTADVWSCGVTLFVMLVGAYPFEDPADPRNFRKTIQRIMGVKYAFPPALRISPECADLVSRIFCANPVQRITIEEIRRHPWFLKNLPAELANPEQFARSTEPHQSVDEIRALIHIARSLGPSARPKSGARGGDFEDDDMYMDGDMSGGRPQGGPPGQPRGPMGHPAMPHPQQHHLSSQQQQQQAHHQSQQQQAQQLQAQQQQAQKAFLAQQQAQVQHNAPAQQRHQQQPLALAQQQAVQLQAQQAALAQQQAAQQQQALLQQRQQVLLQQQQAQVEQRAQAQMLQLTLQQQAALQQARGYM